jgi:hypothetical protein
MKRIKLENIEPSMSAVQEERITVEALIRAKLNI